MGAGRVACVALPLGLTAASIVCLLIVMLGGITDKNLDLFELRTQNLSISSSSLENLVDTITRRAPDYVWNGITLPFNPADISTLSVDQIAAKLKAAGVSGSDAVAQSLKTLGATAVAAAVTDTTSSVKDTITSAISGTNITAETLNLADYYKVYLWNSCAWKDGTSNCSNAKFDWASSSLNATAYEQIQTTTGGTVTLPKDVQTALKTFGAFSKWTQVVYIVAFVSAAIELIFGIFAMCSRIGSCCTFIVSSIATTAIMGAAILATVQASVVVGAVTATAKAYGVSASLNRTFLIITWLAVAFSMGAGLFWLFTICCCGGSSDKKSKNRNSGGSSRGFGAFGMNGRNNHDQEKLIPGGSGYTRVGDDHHTEYRGSVPMQNFAPHTQHNQHNAAAYEPYAHTRV